MKLVKKITITVLLIFICIGNYFICSGYQMYKNAINKMIKYGNLNKMPLKDKITTIRQKEDYTKIDDMPQIYLKAVVSVEDHRFYKHFGIDVISIGRAFVNDIKKMKFVEGGSTITQQLAKNIYFTQDKKIVRKVAEIFMAFSIESNYNKNEILELYLNTSYFGNGFYSVKSASLGYFNKLPKDMNDSESIMLAGIPNAPSLYNPIQNKNLAIERQRQVINKMIKYGNLDKVEAEKIIK